MSANLNIPATDHPSRGGFVWNRLHAEREEVCEALLKEPRSSAEPRLEPADDVSTADWHRELLQARLRKIDDALDRLMSGSYGECVKCGRWIEDTKLHFDPAIAFCVECWRRLQNQNRTSTLITQKLEPELRTRESLDNLMELSPMLPGIALESLLPFDTLRVRTSNSDYRIFLLDPKTGRALVEGGSLFPDPVEAVLNGSNFGGSTLKVGWIGVGLRVEMWVDEKLVSTSPVQSFFVERHTPAEPTSVLTSQVQRQ